jgi:hypothetical protein
VVAAAPGSPAPPPSAALAPPTGVPVPRATPRSLGQRHRWIAPAAGIAIGLGVVLAVVWAFPASTSPSPDVPYSEAVSSSESLAHASRGGNWTVLAAVGVDQRLTSALPLSALASELASVLGSTCSLSSWNGSALPASVLVPSYSGAFSAGVAPFWAIFLYQASSGAMVAVEDLNGSARPLATLSGSACLSGSGGPSLLPPKVADSPAVAGVAWAADGQAVVAQDPNLTSMAMTAFGGGSIEGYRVPGVWAFAYAPCDPLEGGTVSETTFFSVLNLTSGAFSFGFSYAIDCP